MIIENFFIASDSSIDIHKNSISLFGLIEDLQVPAIPVGQSMALPCHIIVVGRREAEVGQIRANYSLTLTGPNNSQIGDSQAIPMVIQPNLRRNRVRVITQIPITTAGDYRVTLFNQNGIERSVLINITFS
ncbi:hypothetical protein [Bdellovibrio bacteriovorus]|uniref:hypothetical protein n=1 Tax=Bdellovibrio bacteriovorus TaxID=959 RepID=UPI003AA7C917